MPTVTKVVDVDPSYMFINRCAKIQEVVRRHGEESFYVSYSGGRDSSILSALIDAALPGNKIPRVYINTGIEYIAMVKHVKKMAEKDDRIVIVTPKGRIIPSLQEQGYPFSRKRHAKIVDIYQRNGMTKGPERYYKCESKKGTYNCPKILLYQFEGWNEFRISDKCCINRKERPMRQWANENKRKIAINGVRAVEGGRRATVKCEAFDSKGKLRAFQPLAIVDDDFIDWYIDYFGIELCKLYLPPFNFKRTGCKGCPFSLDLQKQLDLLKEYLPNEYRHCEYLWKPVYEEYRRIGYRLKPKPEQLSFEDLMI